MMNSPQFLRSILPAAVIAAGFMTAFSHAAPLISSISPSSGPSQGGTRMTIVGSGFSTTSVVMIQGNNAPLATTATATQLEVTVPAGEGINQAVVVFSGGQSSNSVLFSYSAPSISSVSPATASTNGSTIITVVGSSFGLNPAVIVSSIVAPLITKGHTQLTFAMPAGQGTGLPIVVSTAGQSSAPAFISYSPPSITSITPASGPSQGGTTITVTGSNFGTNRSVAIGGRSAAVIGGTHTQLIVSSPPGEGTDQPVVVTTGGQSSNSRLFSYLPPTVTSISPSSGPTAGGSLITLTGSNFGLAPLVSFNGSTVQPTSVSHTQVVFPLPPGQGTNLPVLINAAGQTSSSIAFNYSPPSISSISPANGVTQGGTRLTINGSNFGVSQVVRIGGNIAPLAVSSTHTRLEVTVPAGEGINRPVTVETGEATSNSLSYSYDPPVLSQVTASSFPTAGGVTLTLTGSNFGLSPSVSVGGSPAPLVQGSSTHSSIQCLLPAGQGVNREVQVTVASLGSNILQLDYDPPLITSVSPSTGPTAGNVPITVQGQNFGLTPTVTIGGASAPLASSGNSHTQLVVTLPPGQGVNKEVVVSVGTRQSIAADFDYSPPQITGITYASAPTSGGTVITLTGSHFGTSGTVTINGLSAPPTGLGFSHTQIVCILPPGQGKDLPVLVRTGGQDSNEALFSYDAPSISSITPTSGPSQGDTLITVTGSNFGTNRSVAIGGRSAAVIGATHTQLIVSSPPGEGADQPLVVTTGGQSSNSRLFSYLPPTITSITPSSGPTAGGSLITLTGSNFGLAPQVSFDGSTVQPTSVSHTQVVFPLPPGQGTNLPVLIDAAGQTSSSIAFNYSPPSISSISPANGVTQGGTRLTINGTNFGVSQVVRVGGNIALLAIPATHTRLEVTVPAGEGINRQVTVETGGVTSNALSYSYDPPLITSVTPSTGPTAGNVPITIQGQNFGLTPTVTIGGSDAPLASSGNSHTQLVVTLPPGQGVDKEVVVSVGTRQSIAADFDYSPPEITGISYASAPTSGGTVITLTGSNFGTSGTVTINGLSAPPTGLGFSDTQIVCLLPAGQGKDLPVVVQTGGQDSNAFLFSYDAPSITNITPESGPSEGGTTITVTGSNFGTNRSVAIGGRSATVIGGTHTQLIVSSPPGEGTDQAVVVTTGDQSSNSRLFSYLPPAITSITPSSGPTAGGTLITLTGSNFGLAPQVSFNGSTVQPTSVSHTQVVFPLPPGQGTNLPVLIDAAGQTSSSIAFNYSPPSISSISPANGVTQGGTRLTINGTNFGVSQVVRIGGNIAPLAIPATHTRLEVTVPAGEGINRPVTVETGEATSNSLSYSYDPPLITSVNPATGPTAGNVPITIQGQNFGLTSTVTIGGTTAPLTSLGNSHTQLVVTLPPGRGQNKPVIVTTAGQISNTSLFSYDGEDFSDWATTIAWNGLDSSPGADPRGTGWKNSLAYALGVNPPTATGGETASRNPRIHGKPALTRSPDGRLQLSFWRRRSAAHPDLTYRVLFAGGLSEAAWQPTTNEPQVEVVDDIWEFCVFTDHSAAPGGRFGRVKIELQQP